ncbi:MAG: hypothetical protein Devi2KO_07360 [Devosia indica]|uniref:DUF3052 domain-containing protein n=1 Tax=Devosia TaxID=46913 RepID=UPI000CE96847|nr:MULTISPECIES: DUF3052 domain-containing protein [Devosia]AVF03719.1 DUF3052 domain-containing protein [Devosia sp. I507]
MSDTGYSGTPLAQKLGLKDGQRVLFIDLPETLTALASSRAFAEAHCVDAKQMAGLVPGYDVIHLFTTTRAVLEDLAKPLMEMIARNGMIWVSWPKKAAKVVTDITEDVIRTLVLPIGLVDIKVCAVDQTWSGLKLVIRKELR